MPRFSVEAWAATNSLTRWLIVSRAAVLPMTLSSAAIGGAWAMLAGRFRPGLWALAVLGLLLAHAANNQLNDLVDWRRGVDRGNYFRRHYGAHAVADGLLTARGLLTVFVCTGAAAMSIGVWLWLGVGDAVLWPLVGGVLLSLAYTWPLKGCGLGELAVLLVWGPLMVGGVFVATAGNWSWGAAGAGTLYALAPAMVVLAKHIDKLEFDRAKGVRTLPVRIGDAAARRVVVVLAVLQYVGLAASVFAGAVPWTTLLAYCALPPAWRMVRVLRVPRPRRCPAEYPSRIWPLWYTAPAFAHARRYGFAFVAGLVLGVPLDSLPAP